MGEQMNLEEIAALVSNLEAEQEWRSRQRKRHLRLGFLFFLVLMLILNLCSRIYYADQLPQVEWSYISSGMLKEEVLLEGQVVTSNPSPIYGMDKLRIRTLDVVEGQEIVPGDLLYEVDTEDLQVLLDGLVAEHNTWWEQAQNWYEGARTPVSWQEAAVREKQIEEWRNLLESSGKVTAEVQGRIQEILVQAGDRMDGTPIIRYGKDDSDRMLQAVVTEEQKERVHMGDAVTVTFAGSKEEITGKIDWLEEEGGEFLASVWLPSKAGQGEFEGTAKIQYESQMYDFVIPVSALYKEEDFYCIYVLKEKEGILGTQLSAEKLNVRLLEKTSDQAAIAEELLESGMKIITKSSKDLSPGAIIREKEK